MLYPYTPISLVGPIVEFSRVGYTTHVSAESIILVASIISSRNQGLKKYDYVLTSKTSNDYINGYPNYRITQTNMRTI